MRVVALLAVRNEELYMERCLQHLYIQGVETCLIDNGSTDQTVEIAKKFMDRGVFRIESIPFNGIYEWEKILKFKSYLAKEINADWFIHHDADEIREAPIRFANLVEGIGFADSKGYSAINSDEFVFVPVSEEESFEGKDYVKEMKYYYHFEPNKSHRVNIWKKPMLMLIWFHQAVIVLCLRISAYPLKILFYGITFYLVKITPK